MTPVIKNQIEDFRKWLVPILLSIVAFFVVDTWHEVRSQMKAYDERIGATEKQVVINVFKIEECKINISEIKGTVSALKTQQEYLRQRALNE